MKLIDRIMEANEALAKDLVENDEELDIVEALLDEMPEPIRADVVKRIFEHLHKKKNEHHRQALILHELRKKARLLMHEFLEDIKRIEEEVSDGFTALDKEIHARSTDELQKEADVGERIERIRILLRVTEK